MRSPRSTTPRTTTTARRSSRPSSSSRRSSSRTTSRRSSWTPVTGPKTRSRASQSCNTPFDRLRERNHFRSLSLSEGPVQRRSPVRRHGVRRDHEHPRDAQHHQDLPRRQGPLERHARCAARYRARHLR
ncbi:exported hypothetical protein [Plantibacter sp. T3]|nr:exported hypothetical protein [Plantibacter sp. T3]